MIYLFAMFFTATVETTFFYLCRYRATAFLFYVFGINLWSNFIVNQVFRSLYFSFPYNIYWLIAILELSVVLCEYFLICCFLKKFTLKLLGLVFLSNFITYSCGEIMQFVLS